MRSSVRGYLICVLYFVGSACLFVLIRFVGLSSVPAFAAFDYNALDHGALFGRAVAVGCVIGTIFSKLASGLTLMAADNR